MDIKEKIFDFAYEMAMRDATLRTAVLRKTENNKNESEEENKEKDTSKIKALSGCTDAKKIVKDYIDCFIYGKDIPCFFRVESKVETILNNYVNSQHWYDKAEFTFGNAQKLINMTAKYMFISCYHEDSLRKNFRECHCPMDNIIIETIKIDAHNTFRDKLTGIITQIITQSNKIIEQFRLGVPIPVEKSKRWKGYLNNNEGWSMIKTGDIGRYVFFQELVKALGDTKEKCLSPLEYDLCYWGR
ncbi:MAG: hypothetical protein IJF88_05935 [Oscillospiraceae bacterium]|nr:hypothetical protein [Oscillospiraceae bacterium]